MRFMRFPHPADFSGPNPKSAAQYDSHRSPRLRNSSRWPSPDPTFPRQLKMALTAPYGVCSHTRWPSLHLRFHRSSRWPSLHPTSPQQLKMTTPTAQACLSSAGPGPANPTSPGPVQSSTGQPGTSFETQPQPQPQATHCLHLKFQQRHSSTPAPAQLRSGPAQAQLAHW